MKIKRLLLATMILLALTSCQPEETNELLDESANQIVIGEVDTLDSDILDEARDLWVYLPRGAKDPANFETKYPVLYLLDGNGHFHSVSGMIKQLSTVNGNTVSPEMIVVGIPNTDRMRDLTPTHVEGTSGGGKNFLDFIEREVIPYIESKYPVSDYRTFVGHSLGGLTVIDALVTRPHVFNNFVAIDPSLWWDEQFMLKKAEAALADSNFAGKSLYVAVANTMTEGMSVNDVVNDEDESTLHIRSILQFVETAETETSNGLHFGWKYYDDDTHGSVPLIAEYDAIRFLFPWYDLPGLNRFLAPDSTATPEELVKHIISHYENVSEHFGYEVLAPERFVNQVGQVFLGNEKPDIAFALFELNLRNYPNSGRAFDSMGDYYLAQSDTEKAIEHFSRAVELGGDPESQAKLDELKPEN